MSLPPGESTTLNIRRWGYQSQQRQLQAVAAADTLRGVIMMIPAPIPLREIEVIGESVAPALSSTLSQSAEQVLRRPGAFDDPLRSLQQIPGVTLRSDWDSQISIRGATPDQNLVVIDGFTLPNPYRLQFALGGGMSLLNIGLLQHASLWKSGFSPRFGDRVAGLVMFETKSPLLEHRNELRLNIFDASVTAGAPIAGNRAGMLLAARRNYHDAFVSFVPSNNFAIPRWQDLQIRLSGRIAPGHQIETLLIGAKEWLNLSFDEFSEVRLSEGAQSAFAGLLERWVISDELIWENYLSHFQGPTQLRFQGDSNVVHSDYHFDDRLWSWRSEMAWQRHERIRWIGGMEMIWQRQWANLRSDPESVDSPLVIPEDFHSHRRRGLAAFYVDGRLPVNHVFFVQPGLRLAGQPASGRLHVEPCRRAHVEPRFSITGKNRRFTCRFHWGIYTQTLDWQSLFRREWPMDISRWQELPNEQARLWSIDFSTALGKGIEIAAAAYWRHVDPLLVPIDESEGNMLEFRRHERDSQLSDLMANRPRITKARHAGLELALAKAAPFWNVALRYVFARSMMRDLDDQKWIAAATDRPHDFALDLARTFAGRMHLSSHLRYTSGNPYTPIIAIDRDLSHQRWPYNYRFIYASRNSRRYPDYFRLDLRAGYDFRGFGAVWQVYGEWLNATNRQNIYQIFWMEDEETAYENFQKRTVAMLPQMITGGIAVKF